MTSNARSIQLMSSLRCLWEMALSTSEACGRERSERACSDCITDSMSSAWEARTAFSGSLELPWASRWRATPESLTRTHCRMDAPAEMPHICSVSKSCSLSPPCTSLCSAIGMLQWFAILRFTPTTVSSGSHSSTASLLPARLMKVSSQSSASCASAFAPWPWSPASAFATSSPARLSRRACSIQNSSRVSTRLGRTSVAIRPPKHIPNAMCSASGVPLAADWPLGPRLRA
mmetsp:Transcript_3862/g.11158  ORF Transcript_3862/g.11158 Transcript_3862/m.11158 type:complete len:231 (-) Transcript_3862:3-695(-)